MPPGSRRSHSRRGPSPLASLLWHFLGVAASLAAWGYLTWSAITFGAVARQGRPIAWAFTVASGLGATVCLVLTLVLTLRILVKLGFISRVPGRRARR